LFELKGGLETGEISQQPSLLSLTAILATLAVLLLILQVQRMQANGTGTSCSGNITPGLYAFRWDWNIVMMC